jgi:hypothetical protein
MSGFIWDELDLCCGTGGQAPGGPLEIGIGLASSPKGLLQWYHNGNAQEKSKD